jgi:CDP-glucose 4,6-dehydratase
VDERGKSLLTTSLFQNVYQGRKVFVTGHTGFKGSWLCLWLKMLGAEVTGYSLSPDTEPSIFSLLEMDKNINHIIGDIRDLDHLSHSLKKSEAEIIFHLAAQPIVLRSYKSPVETIETNVMGTVNLLESARISPHVKALVNVTSDKCYENRDWVWGYRENDPMGGADPYSCSKGCAELVTKAYRSSFFTSNDDSKTVKVNIASARAGNVIGGGDWAEDRLIPDFVRALDMNEKLTIRNPTATRPWQFVLEPLSGYLHIGAFLLLYGQKFAGSWNLGPADSKSLTVEEIVREMISIWGNGEYKKSNLSVQHEAHNLRLDISKAHNILGWHPVYNCKTALSETVLWYKNYYSDKCSNIYDYTFRQIHNYIQSAITENNNLWVK